MAMSECVRRVSTLQSLTSELPRLLLYLPFDSITLFAFFAQPRTPVLLFGSRFYARGPKASSARMQPLQPYADLGWCPTIMPLTASFQFVFAQLMKIRFCIWFFVFAFPHGDPPCNRVWVNNQQFCPQKQPATGLLLENEESTIICFLHIIISLSLAIGWVSQVKPNIEPSTFSAN